MMRLWLCSAPDPTGELSALTDPLNELEGVSSWQRKKNRRTEGRDKVKNERRGGEGSNHPSNKFLATALELMTAR